MGHWLLQPVEEWPTRVLVFFLASYTVTNEQAWALLEHPVYEAWTAAPDSMRTYRLLRCGHTVCRVVPAPRHHDPERACGKHGRPSCAEPGSLMPEAKGHVGTPGDQTDDVLDGAAARGCRRELRAA